MEKYIELGEDESLVDILLATIRRIVDGMKDTPLGENFTFDAVMDNTSIRWDDTAREPVKFTIGLDLKHKGNVVLRHWMDGHLQGKLTPAEIKKSITKQVLDHVSVVYTMLRIERFTSDIGYAIEVFNDYTKLRVEMNKAVTLNYNDQMKIIQRSVRYLSRVSEENINSLKEHFYLAHVDAGGMIFTSSEFSESPMITLARKNSKYIVVTEKNPVCKRMGLAKQLTN